MKKKEYVYCLKVVHPDMTAWGGFKWPKKGVVKAPDWKKTEECGNGLHGWLWGEGNATVVDYGKDPDAKWMVLKVDKATVIDLDGKVKFPECEVVFCGSRDKAVEKITALGDGKYAVMYGTATAGEYGTATAGDYGTATAGDYGTATAGNSGTATAGYKGTATAGDYGTATAGDYGTATAGYYGTATAGYKGTIVIKYWDSKAERYGVKVGVIGEKKIKPNVKYRLNSKFQFEEVKK